MIHRVYASCSLALAVGAAIVVACSDDPATSNVTVDAGPAATADASGTSSGSSGSSGTSSSSGSSGDAASPDAAAPAPPVAPLSTTRIANAVTAYGIVWASDGLLYISGATIEAADRKLAVWRYKDGELDATFGTGGVLSLAIAGTESSYDIVEVSPGNFVVHAVTAAPNGAVYLVKMTKDGGGTYSFGTPKKVKFGDWTDSDPAWTPPVATPAFPATPSYNTSWGVALDTSNAASPKIVVFAAGAPAKVTSGTQRYDNDRWIARVMADTLDADPTFNNGSAFSADGDAKSVSDGARRGRVLADGSILSGGYADYPGLGAHVVLIKLTPAGQPDPTFGFGTTPPGIPGQTKVNPFSAVPNGGAECYSFAIQSTGRIVTTGYGTSSFDTASKSLDFISLGLKADGLDPTYGRTGAFAWQSETDKSAGLGGTPFRDRGRDIVALADDRLVAVGVYDDYAAVFVLDKNGKPDPSSGANGLIQYSYPGSFFKMALSPDGKRIATTAESLNQTADAGAPVGSVLAVLKVGN